MFCTPSSCCCYCYFVCSIDEIVVFFLFYFCILISPSILGKDANSLIWSSPLIPTLQNTCSSLRAGSLGVRCHHFIPLVSDGWDGWWGLISRTSLFHLGPKVWCPVLLYFFFFSRLVTHIIYIFHASIFYLIIRRTIKCLPAQAEIGFTDIYRGHEWHAVTFLSS